MNSPSQPKTAKEHAAGQPQRPSENAQPTPERIMRMTWGFAPLLTIHAAIENGIFDSLDRAPKTAKELSADLGVSERGATALLGVLQSIELTLRQHDGRYRLAPDAAEFLVRSKAGFHGGIVKHVHDHLLPSWLNLHEVIRTGKPEKRVNQPEVGGGFFEQLVDALFPMNYPAAHALAKALDGEHREGEAPDGRIRVLDLAAGSGVWGIAQAQASPQVYVTAFDLEQVLPVTRKVVHRMGLTPRFEFVAGDLRTSNLGTGYSRAILGHILHSEGAQESRALLKRVYHCLAPGGTLAIAEFLVNQERSGPPMGMIFAVNMLVHTSEGNTFSFEEIETWLKDAGFEKVRTIPAPSPSPLILADKPKSRP